MMLERQGTTVSASVSASVPMLPPRAPRSTRMVALGAAVLGTLVMGHVGCSGDDFEGGSGAAGGSGGAGAGGNATGGNAGGSTGASGGGGGEACEPACSGDAPLCDETTHTCVACLGHDDCTDASAAQCSGGACVACDDSAQCTESGATLCNAGTCVECSLDDESACTGGNTCDLLTGACVAVGPGSVGNCKACSNDSQCTTGRCIPMEFEGNPHGYYCLEEPSPTGLLWHRGGQRHVRGRECAAAGVGMQWHRRHVQSRWNSG